MTYATLATYTSDTNLGIPDPIPQDDFSEAKRVAELQGLGEVIYDDLTDLGRIDISDLS